MPTPPTELMWLGILASFSAFAWHLANLLLMWRNRGRIQFRTVTADIFYEPYTISDVQNPTYFLPKGTIEEGQCKRAFIIVEFAIKNLFPTEVMVGRFRIDDWMFSDHYSRGMYHPQHDYRVYDLYTRGPVSLDKFNKIQPKAIIGYRFEIYEDARRVTLRDRTHVPLPSEYNISFYVDGNKQHHKIRFPARRYKTYDGFRDVYHWSDLVEPMRVNDLGAARPQPINPSDTREQWAQNPFPNLLARLMQRFRSPIHR